MKFWQVVSWCETEQLVAVAQTAEQLGFEGLILAEHLIMSQQIAANYPYSTDGQPPMNDAMEFADPLISFAAGAAVTQTLKFMTGVYLLGLRHPLVAAKEIATLANISDGRFALGIGSGWLKEEYQILGVDFKRRGRRLDESIAILRKLWQGELVEHNGDFFQFPPTQIRPFPKRRVAIIGGGLSELALRRSAQLCDGWYGPGNSLEELPTIISKLRHYREQAELPWQNFEITAPIVSHLTREVCERLDEMGVHGVVNYPFIYGCPAGASLRQKQDYMSNFAQRFHLSAR